MGGAAPTGAPLDGAIRQLVIGSRMHCYGITRVLQGCIAKSACVCALLTGPFGNCYLVRVCYWVSMATILSSVMSQIMANWIGYNSVGGADPTGAPL